MTTTSLAPSVAHGASWSDLWPLDGAAATAPAPSEFPALLANDRRVVAMRRRSVVDLGGLAGRASIDVALAESQLVSVRDVLGQMSWIPATAVWCDVSPHCQPQRPRPIGLSTSSSQAGAMVAGLSDRLGWEAAELRRTGGKLTELDRALLEVDGSPDVPEATVVLDGRIEHDVPTVVVARDQVVRWGAGATWADAVRRAMYRSSAPCSLDESAELSIIAERLARVGLTVAAVELGTAMLRDAGVHRCSVQLLH